jgi:hypothetical protein
MDRGGIRDAIAQEEVLRQWLGAISVRNAEAESDKFIMMASMNLVNCIADSPVLSAVDG